MLPVNRIIFRTFLMQPYLEPHLFQAVKYFEPLLSKAVTYFKPHISHANFFWRQNMHCFTHFQQKNHFLLFCALLRGLSNNKFLGDGTFNKFLLYCWYGIN